MHERPGLNDGDHIPLVDEDPADASMPAPLELALGHQVAYPAHYQPQLLLPLPRQLKRTELGVSAASLPFQGADIWNAYELSWLNPRGVPQIALGTFEFACENPYLIESKSLKLYLNSLNQARFASRQQVEDTLRKDLLRVSAGRVSVSLTDLGDRTASAYRIESLPGECIDHQDIEIEDYAYRADYLMAATEQSGSAAMVSETLHSHVLKSNCLVTGQPDWASIQIRYTGARLNRAALLRYLVSFRQHNEFHEQCVERIFVDLMRYCHPERLLVYARYTRRGGLDINPLRANYAATISNTRLIRQ